MEIVWTLAADLDLQAIYERLDTHRPGIGDLFFEAVIERTRQLQMFPQIGPVVHRGFVRRALVFEPHYGLFYTVESRGIILHAILDLRRNPEQIEQRLSQI